MHAIIKLRFYLLLLTGIALFIFTCGCGDKTRKDVLSDKPLAVFQIELLDIAFETATAIPVNPHLKDRSRAQAAVVETCLKLDQPKRALAYIAKIDNWRHDLCYANLAFYCAKQGHNKEAQRYLETAGQIAMEDHSQEWRNNRIKAIIVKTRTKLSQTEQTEAKIGTEEFFDEQIRVLEESIETGDYAMIKYALQTYTQLFSRFYHDENQRLLAEENIKTSWDKVPVFIRVELLLDLAGFALDYADNEKALELIDEAQIFIDEYQWPIKNSIPIMARLANLRYQAGDIQKARADADAALALFNAQKSEIVDIYRAEALRPLGQTYQTMGDTEAALSVYKQVIEEGIENPNSRPRAENLSATCCSMALYALEPDSKLWMRIRQISERLGQPW